MYGASTHKIRREDSRKVLNWVYERIPKTKEGECCGNVNQRMFYVEFLNIWHKAIRAISIDEFLLMVEECMRVYLYDYKQVPDYCMFCDQESALHDVWEHRPSSCRISRSLFEKLTPPISTTQIAEWEKMLYNAEKSLGISPSKIHARDGGTCRLFFEHVLLEIMGEDGVDMLSKVHAVGTDDEKEAIIQKSMEGLRSRLNETVESNSTNG